jgi:hypothetical protein
MAFVKASFCKGEEAYEYKAISYVQTAISHPFDEKV